MLTKTKETAIRLMNFSLEKNTREVLAPVTYAFPKGRIGVVVGKSDSQKGAFLRAIAGFEAPTTGDIVIADQSQRNSVEYKKHVFLVSPYVQFNLPCTLAQVPAILIGFYENWDFVTYRNWLEYLGLPENIPYSELSAPKKMKALIAVAMASGADVLIFEDIDTCLESDKQRTLLNALQMKCLAGATAIISSRRITRWVNSDVDLYSFQKTNLIRVDTEVLKSRMQTAPFKRDEDSLRNGWPRFDTDDKNEQTMTMTFVAY